MFHEFYGFTSTPFSRTIPTRDLFQARAHQELIARMNYLVRDRGLGLVTGEIGSGKSTAVRAFAANLDYNRYLVIYLSNPTLGITGLYRDLLLTLGYEPPFTRPRMVIQIRSALEDLAVNKHRMPVLILDEAHLLAAPLFEQLRLLLSDKMDSQSLATLILVGHPDLNRTLHLTVHEAFNQRIATRYHLSPLDLAETLAYIQHHLLVAGYKAGQLIAGDAGHRIFEYTKGIPRRINLVCTMALMAGVIEQKKIIDDTTVRKAIADIDPE